MVKRERAIRVPIFYNEKEIDVLKQNMGTAGIKNRSEYIRRMTLQGTIIHTDLSAIKELSFQISKIGNNVNQIARAVNETGEITPFQLAGLKKSLEEISEYQIETLKSIGKLLPDED